LSQSSALSVACNFHVQDLQNIIKSRSSGSSVSLFESFQKQAQEAAKIPAEIFKAPTEAFAPAPEAPAIPLPITKALPQPTSKAAAGSAPARISQMCICHLYIHQIHAVLTILDVLPKAWQCAVHQVFHFSLALAPDSGSMGVAVFATSLC